MIATNRKMKIKTKQNIYKLCTYYGNGTSAHGAK